MKPVIVVVLLHVSLLSAIEYSHTGVRAVISFPAGSFSERSVFRDDGFARTGIGAAAHSVFTLGNPGLLAVADIMVLYHPLRRAGLMIEEDALSTPEPFRGLDMSSSNGGSYLFIPLFLGLGAKTTQTGFFSLYSTVQIGVNTFFQRDIAEKDPEHIVGSYTVEIDSPGATTAFAFSAGIIIVEKFDVTFRFLNLGRPEVLYEISADGVNETFNGRRMFYMKTVQLLTGINF